MSLRRCIPELEQNGQLNRDQADYLRGLYDELERDYSTKFGAQAAEAMASEEAVRRMEADAALKRRQAALQVKAQQAIAADVRAFKGDNPGAAAVALFTHDSRAPYSNAERRAKVIEGQAHAMIHGILEKHSRNMLGQVRDPASLLNVVREAFGERTGDAAARELAEAWTESAEMLRLRFNAAGGGIGKIDQWGMSQVHDMNAVRAAPFEEWRDFIRPLLDRQRMKDVSGDPITPAALETALRDVWETVRSDGRSKREAGSFRGSGKLGNRRRDSRFLVFKDADAWLAYNQRFGRPTSRLGEAIDPDGPIFDAMMGHIKGMSHDIALMERLGPNPAATVRWITDGLEMEADLPQHAGTKRLSRNQSAAKQVDSLYAELSGANASMEKPQLGRFFGAVRSWQTASKLGSAVLSAVTDVGFQHVTRRFNGIPAANTLANYATYLKPGSAKDRQLATRLWMVAEEMSKMARAQNRWSGEVLTGEVASRLAEGVMRVSGLSAWTQAGRWAFGREFWSHITDEAPRSFDNLNAPFRRQLERYGFTAADWDTIRATPLEEVAGSHWLLPENIADTRLAERLAEMISTETDYAVPQASVRVTAPINSTLKRGTWIGEITRSALLFKSFPITVLWMHGRRTVEQQGLYNKFKYAASLTVSTTIMGALAMQLKNVAGGKDPQDMDDWQFWARATAQGGGWGIFGDFLGQSTNRFDQSLAETLSGPVISDAEKLRQLVMPKYDPKEQRLEWRKHRSRDLARLIQSNTPGSSLWYAKLAFQREIADQLQMQTDPDYYDSFSRMEKRAAEDGTDFWWRPGETQPERLPAN